MKLLNALIPASFAVYPWGYLTNNCVNNLCVECAKTKMIGAVKYTVIDYSDMVETSVTDITNALKDMAYFNGEESAQKKYKTAQLKNVYFCVIPVTKKM